MIKQPLFTGTTYASDKVNRVYIPPPKEYFEKIGKKGGASVDIYYTNFTAAAITSVERAASILEALLPDDVHITILATWENISTSGVLANSSATSYAPGRGIDAWKPLAVYPAALAEKIAGQKLNEDAEGDMELHINSSVNWYLGTDGKTPTLKYDLVTVALHEMIHGLGFFDSFYVESATGSYGVSSLPLIYDVFVENNSGQKLTNSILFPNPSSALKTQLTSGILYFKGPVVNAYLSGGRSRLYAPVTFEAGSSIAHLDEETYKPTDVNTDALMTPFIGRGEAIHNPGKLTRAMLGDIGWINTRIIHEPSKDTEEPISSVAINAEIKSDTSYNHGKVALTWSFDDFKTSQTSYMTSPGSNNLFTAAISIPSYETRLSYYISAEDYFLRSYLSPSDTAYPNSVYIGTDTVKPVLTHTPAEYYLSVVDSVSFDVEATDNIGIDTVYLEYKLNEGPLNSLGLAHAGEDGYRSVLSTKTMPVTGGDSLSYRFIAIDKAASPNQKIFPSTGFYTVNFERINNVETSYATDFEFATGDFLTNGFEVTMPAGFNDFGLHTRHPYESPEETGDSIGYTAMLRTPVRFDESGMIISYYEVVLVEPGEEGSTFGSTWFYDYVIVEASRDFGKNWFALADGYDSRYLDQWEADYNSAISGNNSTFTGDESMLVKHTIFPKVSSHISAGDTMIVRFRLFSDPYANGWGWGIEDLYIGPRINSVNEITITPASIYPNPGNGRFMIRKLDNIINKPLRYSIFNTTGTLIVSNYTNGSIEANIDISGYPSGLYLIVLYHQNGIQTLKYYLIK
ncbi:MAG: T9SS type A sorting domain-containing protein [Bacteroidales bacterium]|nr:T9SS type A sorting domain-containing protein [Bacteroidales bacterium]